jgi:hypothetical protein
VVEEKDEPTVGLDRMGEPIMDPAPDSREQADWPVEIWTGAKWGMAAGVAAGLAYVSAHTVPSLGFYPGDAGLVLVPAFVGGAVVGAAIGWLWVHGPGAWLGGR